MDRTAERASAVADTVSDLRRIAGEAGPTRDALERMKARLIQLARRTDLFSADDFPAPPDGSEQTSTLYRIAEDEDHGFALYANAARGGVRSPVHNHTVWAIIVGIAGDEANRFYARTRDGVEQTGGTVVRQGTGVALLPDDLHAIEIDGPALNLHMYGKGLEQLHERQYFKEDEKRWKTFPAHSDIRDARGGIPGSAAR